MTLCVPTSPILRPIIRLRRFRVENALPIFSTASTPNRHLVILETVKIFFLNSLRPASSCSSVEILSVRYSWLSTLLLPSAKMAQLPPKIPNITRNWPPFLGYQPVSDCASDALGFEPMAGNGCRPSFGEEFSDFTVARRGSHRRSISDGVAFVEAASSSTYLVEIVESTADNDNGDAHNMDHGNALLPREVTNFERLDDEQLMTMFTDDVSMSLLRSSSNPSTPSSDQNSNNDEKSTSIQQCNAFLKPPPAERRSSKSSRPEGTEIGITCKQELPESTNQDSSSSNGDTITDPKRVKRILANRQSAQRSRVRKLQYISELERSVTTLQTEVSALSPKVAFLDHQRLILNFDNSALKQRIAALAQDKIFKDAHQEALKKEIERLSQLYHQQNLKHKNSYGSFDGINSSEFQLQAQQLPEALQNCTENEKHRLMGC